jgi:hypothetical protein
MGRPPVEAKLRQIPVALSAERRLRLMHLAGARDVSIAQEIRERLDRTFEEDGVEPATRELQDGIRQLADSIRASYAVGWQESSTAHKAFAEAVARRIAAYAPPPDSEPVVTDLGLLTGDKPEIVGIVRELDDRRANKYPLLAERISNAAYGRTK